MIEVPGLIPAVPALCLRNLLRIINLFMMTTTTVTIKGLLGYPQLHSAKKFGRTEVKLFRYGFNPLCLT